MSDVAIRVLQSGRAIVVVDGRLTEVESVVVRLGPSKRTVETTIEVGELVFEGEAKIISARACLETCRNLLEHLNRRGGLGLDVHQMIESVLADTKMEPREP